MCTDGLFQLQTSIFFSRIHIQFTCVFCLCVMCLCVCVCVCVCGICGCFSHLAQNPFICDCHLKWLADYLQDNPIETSGARCTSPRRLANKRIGQIKSKKFRCSGINTRRSVNTPVYFWLFAHVLDPTHKLSRLTMFTCTLILHSSCHTSLPPKVAFSS